MKLYAQVEQGAYLSFKVDLETEEVVAVELNFEDGGPEVVSIYDQEGSEVNENGEEFIEVDDGTLVHLARRGFSNGDSWPASVTL